MADSRARATHRIVRFVGRLDLANGERQRYESRRYVPMHQHAKPEGNSHKWWLRDLRQRHGAMTFWNWLPDTAGMKSRCVACA